ncbi:MAG: hypothetical protein ACQESP_07870 [Candidatus Muiribacteriota bacterium]
MTTLNEIEQILEKAFDQMKKRYRDMLDISYSIMEQKEDYEKLLYLINLRGQIIEKINEIQATIKPVYDILKEKTDVEMNDIYEGNSKIKSYRDNIKEIIMAVKEIDDEVEAFIANKQKELKTEIVKVKKSKDINKKFSSNPSEAKIIDDRK